MRTRAFPLAGRAETDADPDEPIDLVAVQADDELINALSAGYPLAASGHAYSTDDRVAAILTAWCAEVDTAPVPELVDLDTAVATIAKARPRSARVRHLAPVAAAAAFLVITMGGVSVGSYSAEPEDALWPISKVLFSERAESVLAADRVQDHIDKAKQALVSGRPEVAAEELQQAQTDLGAIRPEEGLVELADVQDFLLAKAAETRPGMPAVLDAPLTTQPNRPVPPGAVVPATPGRTPSVPLSSVVTVPSLPAEQDAAGVDPRFTRPVLPGPGPQVGVQGGPSSDTSPADPAPETTEPSVTGETDVLPPVVGPNQDDTSTTVPEPEPTTTELPRSEGQQAPAVELGGSITGSDAPPTT